MKRWKFFVFVMILILFELKGEVTDLQTVNKTITVNGKEATVLALSQPDGTLGITADKGQLFNVMLKNTMQVPTSIHWHGLILPNNQDGVAFITQFPIYPSLAYHYQFPLKQSGTYWMHSHFGLQEQNLLSAPLIIYDPEEEKYDKDAILFLADFSFKPPSEIYQQLRCNCKKMNIMSKKMTSPDLVEVNHDAFLINYKTIENPDILKVKPGERVRLRVINGSSTTNFFIDLSNLKGEAIAVDGNRIKPLEGSQFELAVAQRIDIVVTIPQEGGIFIIHAKGEGTNKQAGYILTTQEPLPLFHLSAQTKRTAGALTNAQEKDLHALYPLEKKEVDNRIIVELGGNMTNYVWTLNGQAWPEVTPLVVKKGQRVEILFKNVTSMSHPMHLHGHVFQVTAIDGKPIDGAMRDTILIMPNSSIAIQFDADNPGVWPLHCHILYHLEAGMFTVVRYEDFIQPL